MKQLLVLAVGRERDASMQKLRQDYYRRCSRRARVEEREFRDLAGLGRALDPKMTVVALDERGRQHTSREFARLLSGWLEQPSSTIAFLIGGADGLDDACRARANQLLSLGAMTYAHRLVRLMLAEQLYRAVSILEGAPYHRD